MVFKIYYEAVQIGIIQPAIKLRDGKIFIGTGHALAAEHAADEGISWEEIEKCECGFLINGIFYNRIESYNIISSISIIKPNQMATPGRLDSRDLR